MNIDKDFQKEATHIPMSHLVMENGKPIFQGTLWSCHETMRQRYRSVDKKGNLVGRVTYSPFTIMPAPRGVTGEFKEGEYLEVKLHTPSWQNECDH